MYDYGVIPLFPVLFPLPGFLLRLIWFLILTGCWLGVASGFLFTRHSIFRPKFQLQNIPLGIGSSTMTPPSDHPSFCRMLWPTSLLSFELWRFVLSPEYSPLLSPALIETLSCFALATLSHTVLPNTSVITRACILSNLSFNQSTFPTFLRALLKHYSVKWWNLVYLTWRMPFLTKPSTHNWAWDWRKLAYASPETGFQNKANIMSSSTASSDE